MTDFTIAYYSATAMELPSLSAAVKTYRSLGRPVAIHARSQSQLFSEKAVTRFADRATDADVVFLTLHGGKMSCPAFDEVIDALKRCGSNRPLLIIQPVGGDEEALLLAKEHGDCFGDERSGRVHRYFTFGGVENMLSLIKYLHAVRFKTREDIPPPRTLPTEGVYHPDLQGTSDLDTYLSRIADPKRPTIAIWFYQGFWVNKNTAHIDALVRELERQGANALPVFSYRLKDETLQNLVGDEPCRGRTSEVHFISFGCQESELPRSVPSR